MSTTASPPEIQSSNLEQQGSQPCCPTCAAKPHEEVGPGEQFAFAIGKVDMRFPNLGLEREFQRVAQGKNAGANRRGEPIAAVLREHRHISARVCPLLLIANVPAYVVAPASSHIRDALIDALAAGDKPDQWVTVIGRLGPPCRPTDCAGVVAPILFADEIYSFSVGEWSADLARALKAAIQAKKTTEKALVSVATEVFSSVVNSLQNSGATDQHRALNYVLLRHPGLFLAAAERSGRAVLEKIETRQVPALASRRQVAVVLSFIDSATGVVERLFSRIDVTDEWPFIAGSAEGTPGPLGFQPFIENEIIGPGI